MSSSATAAAALLDSEEEDDKQLLPAIISTVAASRPKGLHFCSREGHLRAPSTEAPRMTEATATTQTAEVPLQ